MNKHIGLALHRAIEGNNASSTFRQLCYIIYIICVAELDQCFYSDHMNTVVLVITQNATNS